MILFSISVLKDTPQWVATISSKAGKSGPAWEAPENIGYPINSSDDDKFFQPWNNEKNAYYTFTTGYKKRDIFYLVMNIPELTNCLKLPENYHCLIQLCHSTKPSG